MNRRGFMGVLSGVAAALAAGVGIKAQAKPKREDKCSFCDKPAAFKAVEAIFTGATYNFRTRTFAKTFKPGWQTNFCLDGHYPKNAMAEMHDGKLLWVLHR